MSAVHDLAALVETYCNREGLRLDAAQLQRLTPTCSLLERERVLTELPTWARRAIDAPTTEASRRA
jgi:hypothetical protein